ncbi:MAG: acylneuraminate cytidylyltransferase family protein [Deltaproteobacteria bacterium]|nr:acylneuraminate cytidylyltransferase family protein [Deltaproteobacteria bacterium]
MNFFSQEQPEVLAIIPARGGSKGLPRKNIRDLCGKPLIAYSIEVALKSKLIDRVVVSTEDAEIAEISKHYGAEVPFLRPKEMAQDKSSVGDGINFTVSKLRDDGYFPGVLVTLYPTHPFRTSRLLELLVGKALNGYSPVNTVRLITHTKLSIFSRNGDGGIVPILNSRTLNGSGTRKSFFRSYGLFLGTNYRSFEKAYLHVIKDPVSLIDIDTLPDLFLAEEVIKQGLFDFDLE